MKKTPRIWLGSKKGIAKTEWRVELPANPAHAKALQDLGGGVPGVGWPYQTTLFYKDNVDPIDVKLIYWMAWARTELTKAGFEFGAERPPCEELSDVWFAWQVLHHVENFDRSSELVPEEYRHLTANAAREGALFGHLISTLEDLEHRRENGRKRSRWCKKHGPASSCPCPPWKDVAHARNAELKRRGLTSSKERARIIAKELDLAMRTVGDEIASPKKRAKYADLYR